MFFGGSIIKDIKKEQTSFGIWVKLFFFPTPPLPILQVKLLFNKSEWK